MTLTTDTAALGVRLKQLMAARGLNQTLLAKKSGVERSVVNRLISGKARPKVQQLVWIAKVLAVDVNELMASAELSEDLRYLVDQLGAARERIRELERQRDEALERVSRLDSELRRGASSAAAVTTTPIVQGRRGQRSGGRLASRGT